jgi:thymidylate synthase
MYFKNRYGAETHFGKLLDKKRVQYNIGGKRYYCLFNRSLTILDDKFRNYQPPTWADHKERRYWIDKAKRAIKIISKDWHTRQACFVSVYNRLWMRARCIPMIHWYFTGSRLCMRVYMRSWNFEKNFKYDIDTFVLLRDYVAKELNFPTGAIIIDVMNLHMEVK